MRQVIFYSELESNSVERFFSVNGFELIAINKQAKVLNMFENDESDMCILAVNELQNIEDLVKAIRIVSKQAYVEIVCSKMADFDLMCKVLEYGADDIFCYPYNLNVVVYTVMQRLKRVEARAKNLTITTYKIGKYTFNVEKRSLKFEEGLEILLSSIESRILHMLCYYKENLVTRELILKSIWHDDNFYNGRSLDVFMVKMRKLLSQDSNVQIMSVRGKGYCLSEINK